MSVDVIEFLVFLLDMCTSPYPFNYICGGPGYHGPCWIPETGTWLR